jgi:glycosyltransferase involved in cell wall biosynthesis
MIDNSVCIATYNGEKYIEEQICSILPEIGSNDEVIIVDDSSKDNTIEIIRNIHDSRIKIFINEINRGAEFTFGRSIALAQGEVIFMSDQDDIWLPGRITSMRQALLQRNTLLVSTQFECFDNEGKRCAAWENKLEKKQSRTYVKNIIDIFMGRHNYFGCAMAFKKELKEVILPIPSYVESHDLWIAKAANLMGFNLHLEDLTLKRRIHGENVSIVRRKWHKKIFSRFIFMWSIIVLMKRIYIKKINHKIQD